MDERLRALQRAAAAGDDASARARYFAELWRACPELHLKIELAAYAGDPAARQTVTAKPACRDFSNYTWEAWDDSGFNHWVKGLNRFNDITDMHIRQYSARVAAWLTRDWLGGWGGGPYAKCQRCGGDHRRDCPFEDADAAMDAFDEWNQDPTEQKAFRTWITQPGSWQEGHGDDENGWWCLTARTPMDPTEYEGAIRAAVERTGDENYIKKDLRKALASWAVDTLMKAA